MIKLDRAGLEYLIEVAEQIGFTVQHIETEEECYDFPTVRIRLQQNRVPEPPKGIDIRKGVDEKQTADIAAKGKATLLDGSEI